MKLYFRSLVKTAIRRPLHIIITFLFLLGVSVYLIRGIQINTDIANLLPKSNPHVQTLDKLTRLLGSEDHFEVAVHSPDFRTNLSYAKELIQRSLRSKINGKSIFSKAELRNNNDVIKENFLYFLTEKELSDITDHIKEEIEQNKLEASPFYVELEEDTSSTDLSNELENVNVEERLSLPPEYYVNPDSTTLIFKLFPTGSKSDFGFVETMFAKLDSLIADLNEREEFGKVEAYYGGGIKGHIEKLYNIRNTLNFSVTFGITAILVFLFLYFVQLVYRILTHKESRPPLLRTAIWLVLSIVVLLIPLASSLAITYAAGYLLFDSLNIMTTVLIAILFGINIDYVLHFYSDYIVHRERHSHARSILTVYEGTGKALAISVLTSGLSLLVLMISEFRGFYEFGILFFIGLAVNFITTFSFFIAVLTVLNRFGSLNIFDSAGTKTSRPSGKMTGSFNWASSIPAIILLSLFVFSLFHLDQIRFEYSFSSLEPKSTEISPFKSTTENVRYSSKSDPTYYILDTKEEAIKVARIIRSKPDGRFQTVASIESIHSRYPTDSLSQQQRLADIREIQNLLEDPFLKTNSDSMLKKLKEAADQNSHIPLDTIPDYFKNKFLTNNGTLANLVIVYPNMSLSDGRRSIRFKEDAATVTTEDGATHYAASTSVIGASILQIIQRESIYLIIFPLSVTLLCMIVFFRSLRWGVLAFIPLAISLSILVGLMAFFGFKFNLYNVIVLPAILGVGADSSIHLFHRIKRDTPLLFAELISTTGMYISASSITTILGFIGLIFTNHPGLQSMGMVACLGIFLALITALSAASIYLLLNKSYKNLL